jgi:hypothetical protein
VLLSEVRLICLRPFGEERAGREPEAEGSFLFLKLRVGNERCICTSLLFRGLCIGGESSGQEAGTWLGSGPSSLQSAVSDQL